jgi:hypothetical protein
MTHLNRIFATSAITIRRSAIRKHPFALNDIAECRTIFQIGDRRCEALIEGRKANLPIRSGLTQRKSPDVTPG